MNFTRDTYTMHAVSRYAWALCRPGICHNLCAWALVYVTTCDANGIDVLYRALITYAHEFYT